MKCFVPEISWHNRDPVYSVDFQPVRRANEQFYRLASGGADCHVVIWHVAWMKEDPENKFASFECAADLQRHQKCVNVVRFSPNGAYLASGDDEGYIIIWKLREDVDGPVLTGDDEEGDKEAWMAHKVLRGHLQDIYDIAWSPDAAFLVSGSIDNTAILWDVEKKKNLGFLGEHKGFVQGVAWDPKNKYISTLSSDRIMRVFDVNKRKIVSKCFRGKLPPALQLKKDKENKPVKEPEATQPEEGEGKAEDKSKDKEKLPKLFHGDTVKTFFRRLTFSPRGDLLIAPCGVLDTAAGNKDVSYVFTRGCFNRPALHLPSPGQYTVAVRCSPLHYQLRSANPLFALPYRIVYAVATRNSLVLYDTEQQLPFGYVYNIHYTGITDVTWSPDGRFLISSSSEGYCSVIAFDENELGKEYAKPNTAEQTPVPSAELTTTKTMEIEPMETDTQEIALKVGSNITRTSSLQSENDSVFKTPTKVRKPDEIVAKPAQPDFSLQRGLSGDLGDDDDAMNVSQCSQISDISVLVGADEVDLISREEQARRLMSPYGKSSPARAPQEPQAASPLTPKPARRVNLITLSSPKSRKKI